MVRYYGARTGSVKGSEPLYNSSCSASYSITAGVRKVHKYERCDPNLGNYEKWDVQQILDLSEYSSGNRYSVCQWKTEEVII